MLLQLGRQGYKLTDEIGSMLAMSDGKHEELFSYVEKDLTRLPVLLTQYISCFMDLNTLDLHGDCKPARELLEEIGGILFSTHIYLAMHTIKTIVQAVGEYLNKLIICKTWTRNAETNAISYNKVYDQMWYRERFRKLTETLLNTDTYTEAETKYFKQYKDMVDYWILIPSPVMPKGFDGLLKEQEQIQRWLFWVLDIGAPDISRLTNFQRMAMYDEIFPQIWDEPSIRIIKRVSFTNPHGLQPNKLNWANKDEKGHHFKLAMNTYHKDTECVSGEARSILQNWVEQFELEEHLGFFEEYEIEEISQLLFLEVEQMIKDGTMIKRCHHCHRYFVVENRNVDYCDGKANGETMPCSQIGSQRAWQKKKEEEYPLKLYSKAYNTKHAQFRRGVIELTDFDAWRDEAKAKLEQVRRGEIEVQIFETWLLATRKVVKDIDKPN